MRKIKDITEKKANRKKASDACVRVCVRMLWA